MKNLERNKNINRGFRKLEVWKESIELFNFEKQKIDSINNISYKVKAQIEDSAISISSNIAEGYCRRYLRENIQFNNFALASSGENYSQIFSLYNAGIIDENWFNEYDDRHYSLENKLIKMNRTQIERLDKNDWKDDYVLRDIISGYSD